MDLALASSQDLSEAELLELIVELLDSLVVHCFGASLSLLGLHLVELLGLGLTFSLKRVDEGLFGPAHGGSEVTKHAELPVTLETNALKSFWHNDALLVVIWERNAFENTEASESGLTLGDVAGHHTAHSLEEVARGCFEVLKAASGVRIVSSVDNFFAMENVSKQRA